MNRLLDGVCQALLFALFFVSGISLSIYYAFFKAAITKKGEEIFPEDTVPDEFVKELSL